MGTYTSDNTNGGYWHPVPMSLDEIRRRLGLEYDLDAYFLERMRQLYAASTHAPLMLTDLGGERPFTIEDAIGYANREMAT